MQYRTIEQMCSDAHSITLNEIIKSLTITSCSAPFSNNSAYTV